MTENARRLAIATSELQAAVARLSASMDAYRDLWAGVAESMRRLAAMEREREERERGGLVDMSDVLEGRHGG